MRAPRSSLLRNSLAALALVLDLAATAAEAPLRFSAAELATAGVRIEPAMTAGGAAAGASIPLAGHVVVPNGALEMVLAPADGRVESILVNPGDTVRAGQGLLSMHSPATLELQRELVISRTHAEVAQARAARDADLFAEGIVARTRMEESLAAAAKAEAALQTHEQLLRLAGLSAGAVDRLRAAADITPEVVLSARRGGSVLQQMVQQGAAVQAGTPLLRIARLDELWVELQATREQVALIHAGDAAVVAGCAQPGRVTATAMQLGESSQTLMVRVALGKGETCVAPGQFVQASIAPRAGAANLLQVPAAAVVQHRGARYVFVETATGLEPRTVMVERRTAEAAWVSGLAAGERVAVSGLAAIKGRWLGLGAGAEEP